MHAATYTSMRLGLCGTRGFFNLLDDRYTTGLDSSPIGKLETSQDSRLSFFHTHTEALFDIKLLETSTTATTPTKLPAQRRLHFEVDGDWSFQ